MAQHFGDLTFTPAVQALQEKYGSRRQYARMREGGTKPDKLGEGEREFLSESDSFYMASVGETGWPYVQHRGGPKGFLKVIDEATIAFADYRGNKQYISTGNLQNDGRVALILVDYPRQARLKILGRAEILEGADAEPWMQRVQEKGYGAKVERVYVIHVEALDWNCPQHITPRFTREQVEDALAPMQQRLAQLERENRELRGRLQS